MLFPPERCVFPSNKRMNTELNLPLLPADRHMCRRRLERDRLVSIRWLENLDHMALARGKLNIRRDWRDQGAIHSTKISGNFGPTGKVSKKRVHLLRWTTFPSRTSWNFGWMDRAHLLLRFSQTCEFWSSKANWRLRFSLPSIILTDRLENKTLL